MGVTIMAKKGRQERQLQKQIKQIQKLEKRLKQKGITVDTTESTTDTTLSTIKQQKKQLERQLKSSQPEQTKPTIIERVKEKLKLTQKQIEKAIKSRKARTKQVPKSKQEEPKPEPKPKKREKLKLTQKQLEKAIQGRKQRPPKPAEPKSQPETQEIPTPKPRPSTPVTEQPNIERQDRISFDSSFWAEAIIANYRAQIHMYPSIAEPILSSWLDRLIEEHGKEDVAKMLEDGAQAGHILTFDIAYKTDLLMGYMADLLDFLPEMTDWYKAEIMEAFEYWEDI